MGRKLRWKEKLSIFLPFSYHLDDSYGCLYKLFCDVYLDTFGCVSNAECASVVSGKTIGSGRTEFTDDKNVFVSGLAWPLLLGCLFFLLED